MSIAASDVEQFYDKFLIERMVGYRITGNRRIEEAARFVVRNVRPDDLIVDIGCGRGIATEAAAKHAQSGHVIGVDISKENIWYASKTSKLSNIEFRWRGGGGEREKLGGVAGRAIDGFIVG